MTIDIRNWLVLYRSYSSYRLQHAVTLLPFHAMSEDSEKTIKMIIDHMAKNKFQFEGELANCLL